MVPLVEKRPCWMASVAAYFLLATTTTVVGAARLPRDLVNAANEATKSIPSLRSKELLRKHRWNDKIQTLATPSTATTTATTAKTTGQDATKTAATRRLDEDDSYDDYFQNYYINNGYYYGNNNNNNNNGGDDNAQQAYGYYWNMYMSEEQLGFDINNYAIKYTGCSTVQQYDDNLAYDEDTLTVLKAQRFATFRLCPLNSCSEYTPNGCGSNYGDYVVSLDQYLAAIYELETERVTSFCEYCQECATIQAAQSFYSKIDSERQTALEAAQTQYLKWYESYMKSKNSNQYGNNNYNNGNSNSNYNNYNYQYMAQYDKQAAQLYNDNLRSGYYSDNNYYSQNGNGYNNANNNNNKNNGYNFYNGYNNYNNAPYAVTQYPWMDQQFWDIQGSHKTYNYNDQSSNEEAWDDMTSPSGTFFGETIYNGYYDQNGDFYRMWGYWNYRGEYLSLEEDDFEWDEGLWGEQPDGWGDVTADTSSCSYKYAGQCYNQYDTCMEILKAELQDQYQYNYQNYKQQQQDEQGTLQDFLECTQIDVNGNQNIQAYQNYYQQQSYNKNKYQNYCNDDDEDCQEYAQSQQEQYEQKKFYVGPHCASNGHDIKLAVFNDEYCTQLDKSISVEELLGYSIVDSTIDLVPDECYPCGLGLWDFAWFNGNEEDQDNDNDDMEMTTQPMCSMLYQLAGKCNKNLQATEYSYNKPYYNYYYYANDDEAENGNEQKQQQYEKQWKQMYQSQQQAENEEAVCKFVSSLKSNTYDESGEVLLNSGNNAPWNYPGGWGREIQYEAEALTAPMKGAMALIAIATASMGIWACVLHGMLARKNIPWRPRRQKGGDATDIARQNSGIVMGRSRSGPGSAPLI